MTKPCFKCREVKPLGAFYAHSQMADGYLNKCKVCSKKDAVENRAKNVEYYRGFDRERGNHSQPGAAREWRKKYPKKYKAQSMVGRHIRDGLMKAQLCEKCGSKAHAHHDDYAQPLAVRWLCPIHHREWHDQNGEGKNGQ